MSVQSRDARGPLRCVHESRRGDRPLGQTERLSLGVVGSAAHHRPEAAGRAQREAPELVGGGEAQDHRVGEARGDVGGVHRARVGRVRRRCGGRREQVADPGTPVHDGGADDVVGTGATEADRDRRRLGARPHLVAHDELLVEGPVHVGDVGAGNKCEPARPHRRRAVGVGCDDEQDQVLILGRGQSDAHRSVLARRSTLGVPTRVIDVHDDCAAAAGEASEP